MEKEGKIINLPTEELNDPTQWRELFEKFEDRLENALTHLEEKQESTKDGVRKEIEKVVREFEERINARFETLNKSSAAKRDATPYRLTGKSKEFARILKSIMSIPDFDLLKRSQEVDEFGLDPIFEKQVMPAIEFMHDKYWRVDTFGLQNIPNQGRALIVANHSGTLPADGGMIKVAVKKSHPSRRSVRFLVEDFVYYFPFLGMYMSRFGGVRACQENAERLLRNEELVVVFPEGVKGIGKLYRERYQMQRFGRGGVIRLALKTGTPIIPTAVIGAEEIYPMISRSSILARPLGLPYVPVTPFFPLLGPLGLIPLPSKWQIYFGEPITFKEYGPDAANDALLVSRLNEELRVRVQEMIKQALTKRVSVWFG